MKKEVMFQGAAICKGSWNRPTIKKKRKEECNLSRSTFLQESTSIPWIRWSTYTSIDNNNPDKLQIKVAEIEPFATRYGIAVRVLILVRGEWLPHYLSLASYNSNNSKLLMLWRRYVEIGQLRIGAVFTLLTYKRKSKQSQWQLRDYRIMIGDGK